MLWKRELTAIFPHSIPHLLNFHWTVHVTSKSFHAVGALSGLCQTKLVWAASENELSSSDCTSLRPRWHQREKLIYGRTKNFWGLCSASLLKVGSCGIVSQGAVNSYFSNERLVIPKTSKSRWAFWFVSFIVQIEQCVWWRRYVCVLRCADWAVHLMEAFMSDKVYLWRLGRLFTMSFIVQIEQCV